MFSTVISNINILNESNNITSGNETKTHNPNTNILNMIENSNILDIKKLKNKVSLQLKHNEGEINNIKNINKDNTNTITSNTSYYKANVISTNSEINNTSNDITNNTDNFFDMVLSQVQKKNNIKKKKRNINVNNSNSNITINSKSFKKKTSISAFNNKKEDINIANNNNKQADDNNGNKEDDINDKDGKDNLLDKSTQNTKNSVSQDAFQNDLKAIDEELKKREERKISLLEKLEKSKIISNYNNDLTIIPNKTNNSSITNSKELNYSNNDYALPEFKSKVIVERNKINNSINNNNLNINCNNSNDFIISSLLSKQVTYNEENDININYTDDRDTNFNSNIINSDTRVCRDKLLNCLESYNNINTSKKNNNCIGVVHSNPKSNISNNMDESNINSINSFRSINKKISIYSNSKPTIIEHEQYINKEHDIYTDKEYKNNYVDNRENYSNKDYNNYQSKNKKSSIKISNNNNNDCIIDSSQRQSIQSQNILSTSKYMKSSLVKKPKERDTLEVNRIQNSQGVVQLKNIYDYEFEDGEDEDVIDMLEKARIVKDQSFKFREKSKQESKSFFNNLFGDLFSKFKCGTDE